jgi:pimeloyl-ACP methyl ester carboxylesterase
MTPLFFGSAQRRLFGAYEAPRVSAANASAVLLCYPWGQEYIRSHRAMRRLASLLAGGRRHVMRFDYFGTGDSMGESREASLSGWEQDIETAMEELRDTSGATRVTLVGLRLGATLAARVAARNKKTTEALILWDPVVSGPEYVGELLGSSQTCLASGEVREVHGFPLTSQFVDELRELDLPALLPALPAQTRVIVSAPLQSHAALRSELDRLGRSQTLEQMEELYAWLEYRDYGAGAIPAKVLDAITQAVR